MIFHRLLGSLLATVFLAALLTAQTAESAGSAQASPSPEPSWVTLPNHDRMRVTLHANADGSVVKMYEYDAVGDAVTESTIASDCTSVSLKKPQLVNAPTGKLSTAAPEFRWVLGSNKVDGMRIRILIDSLEGVVFSLYSKSSGPEFWVFPDNFASDQSYTWRAEYSCSINGKNGQLRSEALSLAVEKAGLRQQPY